MKTKITEEKYNNQISELKKEYEIKINEIKREFAFSNNQYKIGDVIKDNYRIIKIETVKWGCIFRNYPECVYGGPKLKKDLKPFKSGEKNIMWQSSVVEKLQ